MPRPSPVVAGIFALAALAPLPIACCVLSSPLLAGPLLIASLVASSWACAEAWGWGAAAGVVAGAVAVGGVAWVLAERLGGDEGAMLLGVGALAYAAAVGLIAVAAVVAADARREAGRDDGE